MLPRLDQRLGAVVRRFHRETVAGKPGLEIIQIFLFVINDEDARHTVPWTPSPAVGEMKYDSTSATKVSGLMGFSM